MTSWLQRQRKHVLLDLSSQAGFEQYECPSHIPYSGVWLLM